MAIPSAVKMSIAVFGIFSSFSYFAILQEDVYKKKYDGHKFTHTFFILLCERAINALVALAAVMAGPIIKGVTGSSGYKVPVQWIGISGGTQMLAMAASNEALRYVSYPTQVLGKSCKMVPVFLSSMLIGGKTYDFMGYFQVAVVTLGVCIFNFGGPAKKGADDSAYGLVLICISLAMDGFTGGLQDRVKLNTRKMNPEVADKQGNTFDEKTGKGGGAKPTSFESMLHTNAAGAVVALAFCVITGQLTAGLSFCSTSPAIIMPIVMFSLCSAFGQCFIFYTITEFSPLLLTTVTTTRKIFSTVYSVFRNPDNSLNTMQWVGCFCVIGGVVLEACEKAGFFKKAEKIKA